MKQGKKVEGTGSWFKMELTHVPAYTHTYFNLC